MEVTNTIGRRKTATARAYITPGNGQITINHRDIKSFFPLLVHQAAVNQPLEICKAEGAYDIKINVSGGGQTGQAEAVRLAIARALVRIDEVNKQILRAEGMLTRDARMVERKKPGQKKARKRFQFSKR